MLKSLTKVILFFIVFTLIFFSKANASMLTLPLCTVSAEIIKLVDKNDDHEIYLKVLKVDTENGCPVKAEEVYVAPNNYYANDNYPAGFTVGDIIKTDIQGGSYNGPTGSDSYLDWSNITQEDGTKILYKLGYVAFVQTEVNPVSVAPVTVGITFEDDCLIGARDRFER